MLIIVSPNLKRADDWIRSSSEPIDLSDARLFSTNVAFDTRNGRMLGEGDTVVWISGWQEGEFATEVLAALKPCITDATKIIYAET